MASLTSERGSARPHWHLLERWVSEMIVPFLIAAVFMLAAAWTWQENGHVRVDILYRERSPRYRAWVNLVGTLLFLVPFCLYLLIIGWDYVAVSWEVRERSGEPGRNPSQKDCRQDDAGIIGAHGMTRMNLQVQLERGRRRLQHHAAVRRNEVLAAMDIELQRLPLAHAQHLFIQRAIAFEVGHVGLVERRFLHGRQDANHQQAGLQVGRRPAALVPGGAEAGRGEHGHDRLTEVGHVGGHAVPHTDARVDERGLADLNAKVWRVLSRVVGNL